MKTKLHPRPCRYDWKENSAVILIRQSCTKKDSHSVARWLSLGHDLLTELHDRDMLLTGRALADAKELRRGVA